MVYGYPIDVYIDHKNWTHDKMIQNAHVLQWHLLLEEFAPTFHFLNGKKNVVADVLSQLPFSTVIHTLTIIDVFAGGVEIIPIKTKKSEKIHDQFVQEWLCQYPRPT